MGWQERIQNDCLGRLRAGLQWLAVRRGRSAILPAHLATGIDGENAAFYYLRRKGYDSSGAALVGGQPSPATST
jgi:hypothetical protein